MANTVDSVLGKQHTEYKSTYNPSVLAREYRQGNRTQYDIDGDNLPFVGFDTWHVWEVSTMTANGLPVNGIMKIVVPADSPYIVESKSLKLYFFSFNMERLGETASDAVAELIKRATADISDVVGAPVKMSFWDAQKLDSHPPKDSDLFSFTALADAVGLEGIAFTQFEEDPSLLRVLEGDQSVELYSDLLRSNCKISKQPDYGTVFIRYSGDVAIDLKALAQYIVSFRNESHFHEEIVECLYKRLYDIYEPDELMVAALYTRRGGIDICPVRATDRSAYPTVLRDVGVMDVKDYRQ